jgi:hypothetical protein
MFCEDINLLEECNHGNFVILLSTHDCDSDNRHGDGFICTCLNCSYYWNLVYSLLMTVPYFLRIKIFCECLPCQKTDNILFDNEYLEAAEDYLINIC